MKNHTPLSTNKEKTFDLAEATITREKQIHELQVLYSAVSIEERSQICATHKWKPEERIPELSGDVRIQGSALKEIVKRNEKKPAKSHQELEALVKRSLKDHKPAEAIDAETYWYELCKIIFEGFDVPRSQAGELNFRVISEAYTDFFGY